MSFDKSCTFCGRHEACHSLPVRVQVDMRSCEPCKDMATGTLIRDRYVTKETKIELAKLSGYHYTAKQIKANLLDEDALDADYEEEGDVTIETNPSERDDIGLSVIGTLKKLVRSNKERFFSASEVINNINERVKFYGDAASSDRYQAKLSDDARQIREALDAELKKYGIPDSEKVAYYKWVVSAWDEAVADEVASSNWLGQSKSALASGKEVDYDKKRSDLNKDLGKLFAGLMANTYTTAAASGSQYNIAKIRRTTRDITGKVTEKYQSAGVALLQKLNIGK